MRELGRRNCNECGAKDSVVLRIVGKSIFSICKACGFYEYEWEVGDSIEYLKYLEEIFGLKKGTLLKRMSSL